MALWEFWYSAPHDNIYAKCPELGVHKRTDGDRAEELRQWALTTDPAALFLIKDSAEHLRFEFERAAQNAASWLNLL